LVFEACWASFKLIAGGLGRWRNLNTEQPNETITKDFGVCDLQIPNNTSNLRSMKHEISIIYTDCIELNSRSKCVKLYKMVVKSLVKLDGVMTLQK
jgi:hypothetical protein